MKRIIVFVLLIAMALGIAGCASVQRMFTRKKKEPVKAEELKRAKEYYKGQLLFALEDTMSRMLWLGEKLISGEKDVSVKEILSRVEAIGPDDLMRVSKEIFKDENLNLAVIGPMKSDKDIRKALNFR